MSELSEREQAIEKVTSVALSFGNDRNHHFGSKEEYNELAVQIVDALAFQGAALDAPSQPEDDFEKMISAAEEAERKTFGKQELYSNCVILDFLAPITRAQLREIERRLLNNHGAVVGIPTLRVNPLCGEREGNSVIPTIAADEC